MKTQVKVSCCLTLALAKLLKDLLSETQEETSLDTVIASSLSNPGPCGAAPC